MKKEINIIFPNKSKEVVLLNKKSVSYDVKKIFIEELLRKMKEVNLSDVKGLKISSENMAVCFNSFGMEDFWSQNQVKSVSAFLKEPERTVVSISPIARCFICKAENCKQCQDIRIQTILNALKTLQH